MPLHYGYSLGDVHFAIHPADGWPGVHVRNARSPVIYFSPSDLKAVARRIAASGIKVTGPSDHGFARGISFRDPAIGIEWPIPADDLQPSQRDLDAPTLADVADELPFVYLG